jgi:SAM-dependent methyltransferase
MGAAPAPAVHPASGWSDAEVWRRYDDDEQRLTAAVSERMLDLAGERLRDGARVLDIATGRGEPALRAARRVAPHGTVTGTDRADTMLAMAAERAAREGVTNLSLQVADAMTLAGVPAHAFDVALCRWGLMYVDDPVAALASMRRRLVPGGVAVAAFWAEPARVGYWSVPRDVLARHAGVAPVDASVPGTFRFSDPAVIARDFGAAGLRVAHVEERFTAVMEAESADGLVAWCRAFGLARLLADAGTAVQAAWEADLRAEADLLRDPDGVIRLGGVTRLVVAVPAD